MNEWNIGGLERLSNLSKITQPLFNMARFSDSKSYFSLYKVPLQTEDPTNRHYKLRSYSILSYVCIFHRDLGLEGLQDK